MIEYPSAVVSRQYGCKIMTARYYIKYDERGDVDETISSAQLKLEDLSCTRFPLIWSYSMKPAEATAALKIFESTGITLQ